MYFVQDGHHRVSVSRALGLKEIEANVTEIQTMLTPVVEMIEEAGVRGRDERPADACLRVACERYRLIREHAWNEDVMEMIRKQKKRSRK